MCTSDAPSSMTSAHPIPANSQSHSQRGFCVLLKSLKHLFPVYADTCKGTPKGTGLQSYRVPQTAFSIQVVETSHSPWTTCLLGQALPHSVFAASSVPSFRLTNSIFTVTLFSDITLNFWLDLCLQTDSPMALMLLTGFDHLHQLRNWLLFYGFFFPLNHSLQTKMVPKSL